MKLQDVRELKTALMQKEEASKVIAKIMLRVLLGEEKTEQRFPTLAKLIDNSQAEGASTIIGKAILDMTDEDFQVFEQLSLEAQLQSILKSSCN